MDREKIAEELRRRATEMREPSFASVWIPGDPRMSLLGDGHHECAIMRVDRNGGTLSTGTLSSEAILAVGQFLADHCQEYGLAMSITAFNDRVAKSPVDVAVLLEKVAADI